ncbi:MAG: EF-hand domain-containing protein [Saccharothrix sp.]|nr:EF-hand domain-containing protein [Saccharothrix sp.]
MDLLDRHFLGHPPERAIAADPPASCRWIRADRSAEFVRVAESELRGDPVGFTRIVRPWAEAVVAAADTDGDGTVDLAEWARVLVAMGATPSAAEEQARSVDIDGDGDGEVVDVVAGWVRDYLCRSHPRLGRPGPVCPYVPAAVAAGTLWTAVVTDHVEDVVGLLEHYRTWFRARTAPDEVHHALLVVLPRIGAAEVERAQRRCKTGFVRDGLMVGEFHGGPPPAGGVRNPYFRPLWSPVPVLAVRRMVASDLPFLTDDPDHLAAHRALFGPGAPG